MSSDIVRSYGHSWHIRSLGRPFARLVAHVQEEWRHRQTERLLESLPAEIRKDIGWPTRDANAHSIERLH